MQTFDSFVVLVTKKDVPQASRRQAAGKIFGDLILRGSLSCRCNISFVIDNTQLRIVSGDLFS